MNDGPSKEITPENIERIYKDAAHAGNIKTMMDIDESTLCVHIAPKVRLEAILSILKIAPYPIMQYYLAMPFEGVTEDMRKQLVDYAVLHGLIEKESSTLFIPQYKHQGNTSINQSTSSQTTFLKKRPTI